MILEWRDRDLGVGTGCPNMGVWRLQRHPVVLAGILIESNMQVKLPPLRLVFLSMTFFHTPVPELKCYPQLSFSVVLFMGECIAGQTYKA